MIKFKLSDMMGKYKLNITEVSDKTGLSRSTVGSIYHEKAKRIDYDTLEKLCILFNCQPGDMLEYVPEERVCE